ncbi:hypothetical protein [Paenibacillus sp. NPDC057967]|uniref:hypothetical protein n=1 Tax=Paenibacillus sp. NPDC057967 TaxID=3346293 RepID=UPI0036DDA775
MQNFKKRMFIFSTLTIGISILWFLLGTTANFQRGIDLVTTIKFAVIWVPAILLFLIPLIIIKSRKGTAFQILIWPLIIAHFFLAIQLFKSVEIEGWLINGVSSEPVKTTSDGLLDYRLELINLYQKNSRVRLFIHDNSTGQDIYIPIDAEASEVQREWVGEGEMWQWSSLSGITDNNHRQLSVWRMEPLPQLEFLIDIEDVISTRLTQ